MKRTNTKTPESVADLLRGAGDSLYVIGDFCGLARGSLKSMLREDRRLSVDSAIKVQKYLREVLDILVPLRACVFANAPIGTAISDDKG